MTTMEWTIVALIAVAVFVALALFVRQRGLTSRRGPFTAESGPEEEHASDPRMSTIQEAQGAPFDLPDEHRGNRAADTRPHR